MITTTQQTEAADAVALARRAGIEADLWQRDVLRSRAQQMILLCSRQAGKSTVTSLLALHRAIFTPGALILLLAPALRQSQELFRKLKAFMASFPSLPVALIEESALRLEFENGSRIVTLPGKEQTIRGFSGVSLLIVDEASRVDDGLYNAIRPMLAVSKGRIVLLSTPFGKRGFFWKEWSEGGPEWERVKITAHDCPRISAEWLEQEKRTIGDWWFRQEYLCDFVDSVDQVFATDDILRALDSTVQPLFGV
ncbi:MAG: phage terminase large subunit [Blastocatellia bacterium]